MISSETKSVYQMWKIYLKTEKINLETSILYFLFSFKKQKIKEIERLIDTIDKIIA